MMHNHNDDTERALGAELRQLSERVSDGDVDPAADLARAQHSVRRSRLRLAGGLVAGAVAVIAAAQFVGPALGGAAIGGPDTGVMAQPTPPATPKPTPVREPTTKPPAWEYVCADVPTRMPPEGEATSKPKVQPGNSAEIQLRKDYEAAVAVLDPTKRHLEKGSSFGHRWIECKDGQVVRSSLHSKYGWQDGAGGGQIVVTVGSDLKALETDINCGDTWRCRSVEVNHESVRKARVATFDHGFAVIIERTDGESVLVVADQSFGNNYEDPIDGFPFDADDLIKVATDPRITLKL